MSKVIYLVDANSVGYAGQHASELNTGGQPTQAIYNVLMNIRALKARARDSQFMYLWDERAEFRFDLLPEYKAKRGDTPEKQKAKDEYHSQQPYIKKMLSLIGIPQVSHEGLEADDIGYYLANHYASKGYTVVVVTSDKDWLQMVALNETVSWYDPRFDRSCVNKLFESFTGFKTAKAFVDSKCIMGDKSDNVDGIKGLGKKACDNIFKKWPDVKSMITDHKKLGGFTKENIGDEFARALKPMNSFCSTPELIKIYMRNRKLMDLSLAPKPTKLKIVKPVKDIDGFFDFCEELAFHSVIAKRKAFVLTLFGVEEE